MISVKNIVMTKIKKKYINKKNDPNNLNWLYFQV
jgi:hypothetical protein